MASHLEAKISTVVSELDTAEAFRSGDVPVVSTARLLALCEESCVEAIKNTLEPGMTSVGVSFFFEHLAPAKIGTQITAYASVSETEGNRVIFNLSVRDSNGLIGAGRFVRAIVDKKKFLSKLSD